MLVKDNIVSYGHGVLYNPQYLVIHETANPGATAKNHVDLWSRDDTYAVHYVADWNDTVYNCVAESRLCWHVGNANGFTIGIELCHATTRSQFDKVWANAVDFAAWFLKKHGWGTSRMVSHDYCSRVWGGSDHTDPIGYFAEYGRSWSDFVAAVAKRMKGKEVNKQKPGKAVNDAGMFYRSHVANLGWLDSVRDGQCSGTVGNAYALEALKITPPEGMVLDVKAHIADEGWRTWKGVKRGKNSGTGSSDNDPIIGTTGQSRGLQAIEIDVVENPKKLKVSYRVHVGGFGWGPWIPAGYAAGTTGISRNIEAIQIKALKA